VSVSTAEPEPLDGASTKSSGRWSRRPGNFDMLNLRCLFQGVAPLGIPRVKGSHFEPSGLVAYNYTRDMLRKRQLGDTVHFFLDDYRFESCWTSPERAVERIEPFGHALGPDFSVYPWMPRVMQEWQVYRARWVAAYWEWRGIDVIPTATWSSGDSFDLCFSGLPRGVPLAASAVGISPGESRDLFRAGLTALCRELEPSRLIIYGGLGDLADGLDLPPRREYPTMHELRGWRHRRRIES